MQKFDVDDDLAALVERLAKKRPFESLSFNDALRRVLQPNLTAATPEAKRNEPTNYHGKKAPSPSASHWVEKVPELRAKAGLKDWKAVCVLLNIDIAGDSARRRLQKWVKVNRPAWPQVPDTD